MYLHNFLLLRLCNLMFLNQPFFSVVSTVQLTVADFWTEVRPKLHHTPLHFGMEDEENCLLLRYMKYYQK